MLQRLLTMLALSVLAQAALAAEAGKLIFVTGAADVGGKPAVLNAAVQEGDQLATGADGFIYIRTVDNGLFILRPNTKARIAAYHVDTVNPANTRVKLELISGTARSRSGEAVKKARQNFRFNTPVAAIGVRGTDFTVTTDQNVSRVYVISGAIVMTGFDGACRADGTGPCEGQASRELSASQRGQLLQLQRGQAAPQLISAGALGPDQVAPPRSDEPVAKGGADASIDAQKSASLEKAAAQLPPSTPPAPPPVVTPPPVVVDNPPPVVTPSPPPPPAVPERTYTWGRFQAVAGNPAEVSLAASGGSTVEIVRAKYAVIAAPGSTYVLPQDGSVGFALKDSQAYIYDANKVATAATVSNATLSFDFGARTFSTALDVAAGDVQGHLAGNGVVNSAGRFASPEAYGAPGKMSVDGVLFGSNGGGGVYVFDGRLDAGHTADGLTHWGASK